MDALVSKIAQSAGRIAGETWSSTSMIAIETLRRVGIRGTVLEVCRRECQCLLNVLGL
jgi:hypothetical protein